MTQQHNGLQQTTQFALVRAPALAITVALATMLTACGGGSSGDAVGTSALMPTLVTPKSCANVAGNLDVVQNAITTSLKPVVAGLPTVGASAAGATAALAQTLDAVDAITNALTNLAKTQNPVSFTSQLTGAGDAILCSSASLSDSLAQLSTAQTIPGLGQLQQTLATVTQRVADGLVGTTPGGDLTALTNQLVALSTQLATVANSLPASVNQPYLKQVLSINATAFNSLALILGDLGALNGAKLSTDVVGLLTATASSLPVSAATQFGIPAGALTAVTSQFSIVSQVLTNTLTAVAAPTLQAVSAVLGGVTAATSTGSTASSTAVTGFSDLIDGALSTAGSSASTTRVNQVSQQLTGGLTGGLTLVTALTQTFGGLLPH